MVLLKVGESTLPISHIIWFLTKKGIDRTAHPGAKNGLTSLGSLILTHFPYNLEKVKKGYRPCSPWVKKGINKNYITRASKGV